MRIIVIGAGIGGLTTAVALAEAGLPCTVLEAAGSVARPGGGIQLTPNAGWVLDRLGLSGALDAVSVRPTARELRDWQTGRLLGRTPLNQPGAPYRTIRRAELCRVLALGADIRLGARCTGVVERADRVDVRLADGTTLAADLVIGADGPYSVVAHALGAARPVESGFIATRTVLPAGVMSWSPADRIVVWPGAGRHAVAYTMDTAGTVNLVTVERRVGGLPCGLPPLPVHSVRLPLWERPALATWHSGRLVLLGDAAHPLLPFLAQGAAQAIEDAAVLATMLATCDDLPSTLERYEVARTGRVSRVRSASRAMAGALHDTDAPPPDLDWLYTHRAGLLR